MPYLQELTDLSNQLIRQQQNYAAETRGGNPNQAYSSFYPSYEVIAPQYTTPNAYQVAQTSYKTNEFVYSIIGKRARAKAQAMLQVKKRAGANDRKGDDETQVEHDLVQLLRRPNPAPNMNERTFWQIKQISQDIAGFAAFEIEYSNGGDPIGLWYMTPHFCSFMRGQGLPIRAIRYQPYGLQPVDIPIYDEDRGRQKILFFSNGEDFDPLYPGIRFYSPAMAAMGVIEVDNAMTWFLRDFVKNGAKFAGLISVEQTIDETQAADYRRRWRAQHGGAENWADPLILGAGAKYSTMQMNFKDMAFPELDARTESRICNAFSMDPIVASAKAGLDISSYNNKEQAHKHWHYEWVIPSWKDDADAMTAQMLPIYHEDSDAYYCDFDITEVYSLREDRDAQVARAKDMYESQIATKNEARAEIGFDPTEDGGDDFKSNPAPSPFPGAPAADGEDEDQEMDPKEMPTIVKKEKTQAEIDAEEAEEKKFRAFAKRRTKEGKDGDIPHYEFKHLPIERQRALMLEHGTALPEDADRVVKALGIAARAAAEIDGLV